MLNKKIVYVLGLIILFVSFFGSYSFFAGNKSGFLNPLAQKNQETGANGSADLTQSASEPKTEECPMNGQLFSKSQKSEWEQRRPLGIMVENSTEARPQSGLSSADIIYEAVAEGGITRLLNIFYCQDASFVGPVRSARIYFLNLLQEYGDYPLYAHVGGANADGPADALGAIEQMGWAQYNDLNQFSVPFPNYWRDYDRLPNRATEHTVYTSTSKLWDFAKTKRDLSNVNKKGKPWDASFTKWKFQDDAKESARGTDMQKIGFGFWDQFASDYGVVWTYNKASNSYKRENGGASHIDKDTNAQMTAKNIVIVFADESSANDGYPGNVHILYDIFGTGNAIVFQNGQVIKVTWRKKNATTRMMFTDEDGKNVSFVRGQIFIEILPTGNKVTY